MSGEKKSSRTPFLLISAIAFIALGIAIIIYRGTIAAEIDWIIKWVAAGVFAIIGIVNIIPFVKERSKENIKNLIIGVLCVVAAILLMVIPGLLFRVVGLLLGVYLIVEGIYKAKSAIDSKKSSMKAWFVPLIFGIISVIVGGLSLYFGIFNSKEIGETIVVVLGIILAYAGVQNFVNLFFGKKN